MADGQRTLAELGRTVDRIERRQDDLERDYMPREVALAMFSAQSDRILRLEQDKAGRRNALLAVAGTAVGVVLSVVLTYLITRSGAH